MRKPSIADVFPALNWANRVNTRTLQADLIAGFSSAAIVIPQGVAFAAIAGLPPEYGLYTAMITALVAALWGSSMVMISGPTTAISAVLLSTLHEMAEPGSARYIELALMLTIMVGIIQMLAGVARLGGLVAFVSHSVMTAFTTAAAILIGSSQLAGALGLRSESGGNVIERLTRVFHEIDAIDPLAVAIALTTLVSVVIFQKLLPRWPGILIALVLGSALNHMLNGAENGIAMVGAVAAAVPSFMPPTSVLGDMAALAPGAAAIALVGLLEALSIGRSFAVRRKEKFDANQEIRGQGLSNVVGGLFQCYAGSGSFTRSGLNAAAGATTPLAGVFASLFLLIALLVASPLIALIPIPAMSGLILFVAWRLINWQEIRHIVTISRPETVILVLTLLSGLLIELDFAIYVGVIASFSVFIYESSHPALRVSAPVVTASGRRKFRNVDLHDIPECPQIISFRLDGSIYFGSVEHLEVELDRMRAKRPGQKHMVLYLKGVGKMDLAGADLLIALIRDVKAAGGSLYIVALFPPLVDSLHRFHVIDEIGTDHLHISKGEAIAAVTKDINHTICASCDRRVFLECEGLPNTKADTSQ